MTMFHNTAAEFIAFLESNSATARAVVALLGGEGFSVTRLREAVTAPAVAPPAPVDASQRTGEVNAIVDTFQRTGVIDVLRVRAAIDAAVLAALDGINLREAIASLVEERVDNADLDIESLAKEVIGDKVDDLDMEDLAKEVISDKADLDIEDMAKEVIGDKVDELDMEDLAKSAMEDNVDYADVVREVIDAEFSRTEIKHAIKEAITERLSNVQVSVTV
jgi:hypothetical protein